MELAGRPARARSVAQMTTRVARGPGQTRARGSALGGLDGGVDRAHAGSGAVRVAPDAADDREQARARPHERGEIGGGDTADGARGHLRPLHPPAQHLGIGQVRDLLGGGRKERAERDVAGAVLHGAVGQIVGRLAGDAERAARAHQTSRLARRHVLLPDVGTVAPRSRDEVGAVVQQELDAARLADGSEHVDRTLPRVIGRVLQPELHRGDVTGVEGLAPRVGEGMKLERLGRDDVEARARGRHVLGRAFVASYSACSFSFSGYASASGWPASTLLREKASLRSPSAPASATSAATAWGITITPSGSATRMSPGITSTPAHEMGTFRSAMTWSSPNVTGVSPRE